jgi:YHS domain-containing protein
MFCWHVCINKTMKNILFLLVLLTIGKQAIAQNTLRTKHFNTENNVAIQGYDPVSYFTSGKAVEGQKSIVHVYNGITYYFSSQSNRELFKKDPTKYEPQYGGWCAYAMGATGEKVEIDPETFKIVNGKLYLFYNAYFNNTLPKWNSDQTNLKSKADKNWIAIFK